MKGVIARCLTRPAMPSIISQNNICIDCNQQALKMFACSREELIGRSPEGFSPAVQPDGSDSRQMSLEKYKLAVAGSPQFFEWTHQRRDGATFEAEVSLSVIEFADTAYVQAIIRDITERKQAEKQLARQASAIEQAAEEIIITDSEGVIEYANPAFEQISGYSRAEAIGKAFSFLESKKEDYAYTEMWAAIRAGEVWRGRLTTRRKDGSLAEADATVSPIFDPAGNRMGYVFVKRDVTEQIKVEAMFRQSQKMEAIGTLAGGIAHDFNNILSAIFGFAEIAKLETAETSGVPSLSGEDTGGGGPGQRPGQTDSYLQPPDGYQTAADSTEDHCQGDPEAAGGLIAVHH